MPVAVAVERQQCSLGSARAGVGPLTHQLALRACGPERRCGRGCGACIVWLTLLVAQGKVGGGGWQQHSRHLACACLH